jgi:toxin ParE1/3/4
MRLSLKVGYDVKRLDIKATARAELAQIYDYSVAEFGREVAEVYLEGLRVTVDRLLEFPFMGAIYPDVKPEVRVMLHRSHRVFYRIEGEMILIVRILHKMRDARAVFE